MSIQHVPPAPAPLRREPQAMLFTPGARLAGSSVTAVRCSPPTPNPSPTSTSRASRPRLLTAQEEGLIAGELFPPEYRQQIGPNLVRLDASLTDLARYNGQTATHPAAPAYYNLPGDGLRGPQRPR
jgi:hypothetical protein